jgi:exosortase
MGVARDWSRELQERWAVALPATRLRIQVSVLVIATLVAYHYSLESLVQTVGYDTPLADVGLVPFIAAGLAFALRNPRRPDPPIQDRQLDYIIGVPLIAIALCINEFLPRQLSVLFWVRRMDLISLPFFVAGAVTIIFGTRVLWRQKFAILYLFLAWPWPYTSILLGSLNGFTNVTVAGLKSVLGVVHLGSPITAGNGEAGLFQIVHNGSAFPVSVVTACSGVDGMVGFFLVGTAFTVIVHGTLLRKVLWLAVGLVLLWTTNLLRLLLIFWAGHMWGEDVALKILHPFAGLVIFCIGVLLMMLLLRPFGLHFGAGGPDAGSDGTSNGGGRRGSPPTRQPIFMASGLLAVVGLLLAVNNSALISYNPVADASGEPKLASYLADPASPAGWVPVFTTEFTENKSLFGNSSRWFRYTYFNYGRGDLRASLPVTADVINAAGVSSFSAYGVEACYNFHGYTLRDVARVSLGDGITGQTLSYATPTNGDWSIVYWIWPVKNASHTRYERIILFLQNTSNALVVPPANVPGIAGLKGALSATSRTDERLRVNRAFLVAFAREVIQGQVKITEPATEIGLINPPQPPSLEQLNPKGLSGTPFNPTRSTPAVTLHLSPAIAKMHEAARRYQQSKVQPSTGSTR